MSVEYLAYEDALEIGRAVLGEQGHELVVINEFGLDSALARPQQSVGGADAYTNVMMKAAALLHSVVRNNGLKDGNKRLGWACGTAFLRLNDLPLPSEPDEDYALVVRIADGDMDVKDIARELHEAMGRRIFA